MTKHGTEMVPHLLVTGVVFVNIRPSSGLMNLILRPYQIDTVSLIGFEWMLTLLPSVMSTRALSGAASDQGR